MKIGGDGIVLGSMLLCDGHEGGNRKLDIFNVETFALFWHLKMYSWGIVEVEHGLASSVEEGQVQDAL